MPASPRLRGGSGTPTAVFYKNRAEIGAFELSRTNYGCTLEIFQKSAMIVYD
jgi:hypothetical protein